MIKDSLGKQLEAYILHLPGKGKEFLYYYLDELKEQMFTLDKDVTLITTATKDTLNNCPLIYQLNKSNISYINSAENYTEEWQKITKLPLICNSLLNVTTPYVLILDANDVVVLKDINTQFIETFNQYNCDILFNGSQYLYPKIISAHIEKSNNSPFINHYLNAGVCFGRIDQVKKLYDCAYYFSTTKNYYPIDSEQYYVRIAIIENRDINVKIDDGSHLFLTSHGN